MLKTLSEAFGPSGCEDEVRDLIYNYMKPLCDEIFVDNLGNLICHKKGKLINGKSIMLSAHMDEVGFIVSHITDDGYLKIQPVGGISPEILFSKRVVIGKNRIKGIIGTKPVHFKNTEKSNIKFSDLFVDIGAKSREDALKYADKGDYICFDSKYVEFGDGFIKSKALDDRVGCYSMIKIAEKKLDADIYYTFTVQEEVGCRGSKVTAKSIEPELAIVIEGTTCSDVPGTDEFGFSTHIGNGPALSMRDGGSYADIELTEKIFDVAKKNSVKCQYKQTTLGGNDASSIQISGSGTRVTAISVPCRYIHSQSNVAKWSDIESLIQIVAYFIEEKVN